LSQGKTKHASGSFRERVLKAAFTLLREQARDCRIRSRPRDCPNAGQRRPRGKPKTAWRTGQKSSVTGVGTRRRSRIRLLMRVRQAPTKREIEVRARAATETLMAFAAHGVSRAPEVKLLIECAPRNDPGGDESLLKICTASGPDPIKNENGHRELCATREEGRKFGRKKGEKIPPTRI
jgi:hypothetical protein